MMYRATSVEELAAGLKPLFGKKIDELYFRYSVASTLEEKNEIHQILSSLYQKHLNKLLDKQVLLAPPKEGTVDGEYPLAKVSYADKDLYGFGLREKDWPRHVCVSGMSGSGKTTFAINILKEFIKKDKPFLVFDWKSSFRPLTSLDKNLMTFTVGNDKVSNLFKVNINRPPKGVNPKEWINTLCDLLTESFSASFGVHKILLETLDEIYEAWGIYKGATHYPNWQHVKRMLEAKGREAKGRETGWYESALRIASVLTFGSFGQFVNYDGKRGMSIEDLFDKRVVLELNSLSTIEKKFFCEYVLTYIYRLKKANPNAIDAGFNHAILVDEAHNVFLKKTTNFMAESVTDMIYREMREYGTGLICLDQHISKLSDTVVGNSACHIAFQQQLPQDIEAISSLMQMRETKESFSQLPIGKAIIKLSERHTTPFLVSVPYTDLREGKITDDDIRVRAQCLVEGFRGEKEDPEFIEEIKFTREPEDRPMVALTGDKDHHPISEVVSSVEDVVNPVNSSDNRTIEQPPIESAESFTYTLPFSEQSNNRQIEESLSTETDPENPEISSIEQSEHPLPKASDLQLQASSSDVKSPTSEMLPSFPVVSETPSLTPAQEVLYYFACEKMNEGMKLNQIESLLEEGLHEEYYTTTDIMKAINHAFEQQFKSSKKIKESVSASVEKIITPTLKPQTSTVNEIKIPTPVNTDQLIAPTNLGELSTLSPNLESTPTINSQQSEIPERPIVEEKREEPVASNPEMKNQTSVSKTSPALSVNCQPSTVNSPLKISEEELKLLKFLKENPAHKNATVALYDIVGLSARKGNVIKNKLLEKNLIKVEEVKSDKGWKKYIRLA
ncbi:MAG: DUF87 domain-containing protein [Nanoarchaeota archaeon]|jgi:hypothetical protein|nr:DUF87 domain-containing protein [Nanoarchaeota archaeon]